MNYLSYKNFSLFEIAMKKWNSASISHWPLINTNTSTIISPITVNPTFFHMSTVLKNSQFYLDPIYKKNQSVLFYRKCFFQNFLLHFIFI